jgi:ribosomal protein S27AE
MRDLCHRLAERHSSRVRVLFTQYSTSYPVKLDTQFRTFDVPASEDGFAIYEGRWPFTGDVLTDTILTKHHAHVGHFHFNLLIAGSARELGLDREQFFSRSGCDAVATRHAGYSSNLDMLAKLIERCPRCFSMTAANSRVLCAANASAAEVHDRSLTNTDQPYRYNRRAAVRCNGNGFRVRENAVYTSLSFFGVQPTFPGPAHLYESGMNTPVRVAQTRHPEPLICQGLTHPCTPSSWQGFYPMHSTWSFFYKADNITAQVRNRQSLARWTHNWTSTIPLSREAHTLLVTPTNPAGQARQHLPDGVGRSAGRVPLHIARLLRKIRGANCGSLIAEHSGRWTRGRRHTCT